MKRLMMILVVMVIIQEKLECQTTMPKPKGFSVGRSSSSSSSSGSEQKIFSDLSKKRRWCM